MTNRIHWNTLTPILGAFALALTGCGNDDSNAPSTAPPDPTPQTSSFEINLTEIDDSAFVSVNGVQVATASNAARISLDRHLLPGENTLEVVLGNGGCFATSLSMEIFENGRAALPQRNFRLGVSHCGYQLRWRYSLNTEGGVIELE